MTSNWFRSFQIGALAAVIAILCWMFAKVSIYELEIANLKGIAEEANRLADLAEARADKWEAVARGCPEK